ncbi:MAG: CHAP domain-containing protein [Actinomycetota bacterium]|nr:CHAP domain-containing protein [Actinomycetota bacterium]
MGVVRVPAFVTVLVAGVMACWSAPAGAQTAPLSSGTVWAGGSAYVTMTLAAPADQCQLVASAGGRTQSLSTVQATAMHIAWVWQVPARARSATWRVSVICGSSQIGVVLTVHGRKRHRTRLSLARQLRVFQFGGSFPDPQQLQLGLLPALARTWWSLTSNSILSAFHKGQSAGQCTDYVAAQRPDVIAAVDIWAYVRALLAHTLGLAVDWVAKDWAVNAQRAGLSTGNRPETGAVVVFQPGSYGALSAGHVALVSAVAGDGSFTVSEMHAPAIGRVTTRRFGARTAQAMALDPGVTFVY